MVACRGATDPKIQFYETIKEIEQRMGGPKVSLDSFIIRGTSSHIMRMLWGIDKPAMKQHHVLFQKEDQDTYIREMAAVQGIMHVEQISKHQSREATAQKSK